MKVIENQRENITVLLQNSAVNPLIARCAQFWSPHLRKDKAKEEKRCHPKCTMASSNNRSNTSDFKNVDEGRDNIIHRSTENHMKRLNEKGCTL